MFYNKKKTIFFVISLILAIGLTVFQYVYFQGMINKDPLVEVCVAEDNIGAGELIKNVKVKNIPESAFTHSMIRAEEKLKGYSNCKISKGSYIMKEMISEYKPPVLRDELRRVSVSVNLVSALAGKIKPGDYVDVGFVSKDEAGERKIAVPKAQIYDVVNSKGSDTQKADKKNSNEYDTENVIPSVVTLLVTPEQAVYIKELEARGSLFLIGY
jgi:pilus assembly protein CpaB